MNYFESINPTNGKIIKEYLALSEDELNEILLNTDKRFDSWKKNSVDERSTYFLEIAEIINQKKNELSELLAAEMGKPIMQGKVEIEKCALLCRYYANNAALFLKDDIIKTEASKSYATFQPLGTILGIMPWNFPFWQVFRFAVPTMIAGNTILLKHAPNVLGCAKAIQQIFEESSLPNNCYNNIIITHDQVSSLIKNKLIKGISFTGSTKAGKKIAAQAGQAIKKSVLELGGNDPYIILKDADLDDAAKSCVAGRLLNSGQSCIAAKRFIVEKSIKSEFVTKVVELLKKEIVGDPFDLSTTVGPMVSLKAKKAIAKQLNKSINLGAKKVFQSDFPNLNELSAFHPVVLLDNVRPGMPAFDDELFGPVSSIITADNDKEAISLANKSSYGLGSAIFTKNIEKGERIARNEISSGAAFVNDFVKSDPRLPFGGIKNSGYGNELSRYGILEFVNVKTILIK